ncbi:MAG: diadenylate cyclase CdaA [Alistipes sp.]|nr:diadenylate cyclase CdaA [Alistipes sp.]
MDFIPFTLVDFIDILLVSLLLYGLYRATKGTNALYILSGIVLIYLAWVVVNALNMELLSTILSQIISVGVIAFLIVFQPEIRRFLQMIGMRQKQLQFITRIFSSAQKEELNLTPIVDACREMSESKTGALIVIGQRSDLTLIIDGGISINATVSQSLLQNIFFKNAPLHDGAVVVEDNRIVAAKCILPVTQSAVPKSYGTRHRAALGMSEISDAIILVVSEETGGVSIAHDGQLRRNITPDKLEAAIRRYINANDRKKREEQKEN